MLVLVTPIKSAAYTARALPPAGWPLAIILAAARTSISRWRLRIALEKAEKIILARDGDRGCGFARDEAALRMIVQHRDELGTIVCFFAQRFVRNDDR